MDVKEVQWLRDAIVARLKSGSVTIRYKDDPDHTTLKTLNSYVKARGATEADLFGALQALIKEGAVEVTTVEARTNRWGSAPEPRVSISREVTYALV